MSLQTSSSWLKHLVIVIVIVTVIVIAGLTAGNKNGPESQTSKFADLAKCLSDKGWVMYGLDSCPHCLDQKQAFGRAFQYINYVECRQEPQKCIAADIEYTPTWLNGSGERLVGFQQLQQLAALSGCPFSQPGD